MQADPGTRGFSESSRDLVWHKTMCLEKDIEDEVKWKKNSTVTEKIYFLFP